MQTKPQFGIDAPGVVRNLALLGSASLLACAACLWFGWTAPAISFAWAGGSMLLSALWMLYSSRYGKPRALRNLLAGLALKGDESLLDVGCGRGMLLLQAARQLPRGRVTGLDLWSTHDQSGNAAAVTERNAALAGVGERCAIDSGDMRAMPYPDGSFDVVVSSLAIHNLPNAAERERALAEIVRVLKPGGQIALLDFIHTAEYLARLRRAGLSALQRSAPDLRMFPPTRIVQGRKPAPTAA